MQTNFKAPRVPVIQDEKNMEELYKDPAYIEYINRKAEEDFCLCMIEKNLEPC
jgi:hypothetical protein